MVYFSPIALSLSDSIIREPDLLFISNARLGQRRQRYIEAPVNWVAEVISEGSRQTDEVDKLKQYAEAGIPEYWLVDSEDKSIRVYVLAEGEKEYTLHASYSGRDVAYSPKLTGFSAPLAEVFETG